LKFKEALDTSMPPLYSSSVSVYLKATIHVM
jgi:hypothetical protein